MRVIGDVHGKKPMYLNIIRNCEKSVQVGDMGIGFPGYKHKPWDTNHVFFPGNHDNPEVCIDHPNCIGYWGEHEGMFYLGGAESIDRVQRKVGIDWWPGEELEYAEMLEAVEFYAEMKPDIVLTHDAPFSVCGTIQELDPKPNGWGPVTPNRTTVCLDELFRIHRPRIWVCGHWHIRATFEVEGTRFEVLPELGFIDL